MNNIDKFLELKDPRLVGIIGTAITRQNRHHAAQIALMRCITVREDGKNKFAPAFSDSVLEVVDEFREAEASVATVRADIEKILGELGEIPTVSEMGDNLRRARMATEAAERELRIAISKASITEGESAMESKAVIDASIKRDRVRDETGQIISDLEARLAKIGQILERY